MGDPFRAVADIIVGIHNAGKVQGWARLIFSMVASYLISLNVIAGTMLAAGSPWGVALGSGMLAGAGFSFVAFTRANRKLTEGVVLAVPQVTEDAARDAAGRGPLVTQSK